ncbi:MAG: amidohydrolase family protein [Phycisphaerales bacterium]|nr:amidohydrolase family protein [Phycisphaerales bacterium]
MGKCKAFRRAVFSAALVTGVASVAQAQDIAVRGEMVYTMAGEPIENGVVVVRDGKIAQIGTTVALPAGMRLIQAKVVTPGLIDAHSTLGLTGMLNQDQDQDQFDHASPLQPELRAIDAYNPKDELVDWVRSFGITTVHTGHAPGELMSGQTIVVKTRGNTVEEALVRDNVAVAATLSSSARKSGGKSPGTRGKMVAMLREQLIKAQEYKAKLERYEAKQASGDGDDEEGKVLASEGKAPPTRDLRLESLVDVLDGRMALLVTADRAQDIASVIRLQQEFGITVWLDSASEAHMMVDEIKASGLPVILHPTMTRAFGDHENVSMETAGKLAGAGVPVFMQSGFEGYVPKVRVVLFEAGVAAANGLGFDRALKAITIDAAKLLDVDHRVGSLEVGKDGDLALYDGDPFEYTSHCTATIIDGVVVSEGAH